MKTKLKLMMVAMLAMIFIHSQARSNEGGKGKQKHARIDSMAVKYNLTEAQKIELAAGFKALKPNKDKSTENRTKAEKQVERKQKALQKDSLIKAVFTSVQYAQYQADVKKRKELRQSENLTMKATKIADSMTKKYAFNTTQNVEVKQAYLVFFTNVKTAKVANKDNVDKSNVKTTVKAERKNLDAKMKTILSETQYKEWKAEIKTHKKKGKVNQE